MAATTTQPPAPAPADELIPLSAYPVVTDVLHNLLIASCAVGAAFGFWNGSAALGVVGLLSTVAANGLSNLHVHKSDKIAKALDAIQKSGV